MDITHDSKDNVQPNKGTIRFWNYMEQNAYECLKLESLFIGLNRAECQKADSFCQNIT